METQPSEMTTLSTILEKLRKKGLDNEFKMTENGFTINDDRSYNPDELTIIKTFRFEGESDPADSSILYLIQTNDNTIGYNLDAYGAYSEHEGEDYANFIKKIPVEEREEQAIFEEKEK